MSVSRFLSPGKAWRHLTRVARAAGPSRALSPDWPGWVTRQLLAPLASVPMDLQLANGLHVPLADDVTVDSIVRHVFGDGQALYFPAHFEPPPPGGLILDVGAHAGLYALAALHRFPDVRVLAVEPNPKLTRQARAMLAQNGLQDRVEWVEAGIAAAPGRGALTQSPEGSWGNHVQPGSGPIRLLPLEDVLQGRVPHTVKCNAEGGEYALVPALKRLGLRPKQLVLMLHPEEGEPGALVAMLTEMGYEARDADQPPLHHRYHLVWRGP